jgi:hypothetical protein
MIPRLRKRFTYTNVILTVALVFAMTGGAYAAKHYLITSTKQISPNVLKTLAGKKGPAGPAGVVGPAGPAGPAGKGEKGDPGSNGTNGTNGTSVTSKELKTTETACNKEGGSEFTAAEGKKTTACNGKEGSPWTVGGTLPKGASERGQWSITGLQKSRGSADISFSIPLKAPLTEERVHLIEAGEGFKEPKEATAIQNGECTGTWETPGAGSGNLCVFFAPTLQYGELAGIGVVDAESNNDSAGLSGAVIDTLNASEAPYARGGSWVVTG